jgi:ribosomal protein S18 acetylase RimI-like enzyme
MKISIHQPSEVDSHELAVFLYSVRQDVLDERGISLEGLERRLDGSWNPFGSVLARSDGEVIGCVLLYRLGNSDLIEINPGSILGNHPLVSPGFDEGQVSAELVGGAKSWVVQKGFDAVYLDIPWDPTAPQEPYERYRDRYGALGIEVIQQVRQMDCTLPAEIPATSHPPAVELAQVRTVDREALYQCHYAAYMSGDAQYFYQMDDRERRADFERITSPDIREHPASLAITQEGRIIGYCLLFGDGDFSELMSLAVLPDFRRRGLGIFLLGACLQGAARQGHRTMHLIVDVRNEGAARLYRKCGFKEVGGNMTFKWKA